MCVDGKWTYNETADGWWNYDTFETKEEAIKIGKEHALEERWKDLYVGQTNFVAIDTSIDANDVIYEKSAWLDDNYGAEFDHGQRWTDLITSEETMLLSEMFEKAFKEWLDKTGKYPTSYTMVNIEKSKLKRGRTNV